uniref:Eukaryotic translation initiation factor 4 gamma 2 n=1 Tax=Aceria tosichella TaxID=561515 RepID=A0A6G1S9W0_9ACAR
MTKEDYSGQEAGRFSTPKRRDLFLNEYLANTNEERQDVIFRRVRGILNKITPETFDKLSKDLVNVGLDSPRTLRGLIYLLFDKALKDLKYSSLYAKLCQKLSEKSPNFEKEPGPNTFCKFLISKCEDEFERRRKATEDFECKNELTDEEFEQKVIAKQKMLGNIKFICELGKKRLLQEEILHECIRGLLSRKKERPLQDQAQDLECLCQIMRTIGSLLDIETSKNLMNQYFERIDMYSRKPELPSRIRFMLRDVIDLRNNNWRPRPFQREDNVPQPLSKLREEAGFSNAASNAPIDKLGNTKNLMNINNLSRLNSSKLSSLMIDDDEPGFTTTTDFHWGSSAFLPHENEFDIFSSNTYNHGGETSSHTTPIVNPVKMQGSTNAPNPLLESSSTVSSFKSNSKFQGSTTAPSSGPVAPRFLQTSRYESFVGSGQNNFDTFAHSYQTNDSTRAGHDRESASSNSNDTTMASKRNDHTNDRHNVAPARGYDKRFPMRETPLTSQSQSPFAKSLSTNIKPNEIDATAAISQQSVREEHLRCNNLVRNTAPQHHHHHPQQQQQQQHRHPPRNTNLRDDVHTSKPYIDSPRPLPHSRTNDNSLSSRNTFMPRNQHASDMPPPPPPSQTQPPSTSLPSMAHHSRNNQFEQQQQQQQQHYPDQVVESNQLVHRHNHGAPPDGNMRPRRFDRGGRDRGHEHEQRQPKFSGANYRLPGRDRPAAPQAASRNANQQPESELNLNWRSADTARSKQQPVSNDLVDCQPPSSQMLNPRQKQGDICENSNRQIADSKQQHQPLAGDGEVTDKPLDVVGRTGNLGESDYNRSVPSRPHQHVGIDKSRAMVPDQSEHSMPDMHLCRTPSPHQIKRPANSDLKHHANRDHPPPRFSNNNNHNYGRPIDLSSSESNPIHASRQRRSNHNGPEFRANPVEQQASYQQHAPMSQNNRNEAHERINLTDRRDFKVRDEHQHRLPSSPQQHQQLGGMRHDSDHKQPHQRPNEVRDIGHDRKINRPPAMSRNQSFEGHNSVDFKRGPNWRSDNSSQGNNMAAKKDVLPAPPSIASAHHQVLTRPPIRMSETDFSLRPSHNLVGRAVTEHNPKPIDRNVDSTQNNTGHANQSDAKPSTRPPLDLSARQIFGPKESADNLQVNSGEPKDKTASGKGGGGDTVNQSVTKFMSIVKDYLNESSYDTSKLSLKLKDLKLTRELHEECLVGAMKYTIVKTESDREKTSKLFSQLVPSIFEPSALLNAFKIIFEQMKGLEVETPKVKSLVAGFLSRAVVDNLLTIEEVARVLNGGKHHPLFLLFLQKLEKSGGQAWLSEKFINSKINLMDMLPEVDRTKDRLASALKDRCLGFLDPMLTIEPDLWAQMRDRDPSPGAVYRWIKDNVDQTIQSTPTFAHVFISCLLKYIHSVTAERFNNNNNNNSNNNNNNQQQQKDSDSSDSSKSSPTTSSSQGINDHEKELLSKYQQMMHAILKDKQMQLATLYALQSFYHGLNFPKGALLRWFHMLYDLSIVDDDVFFIWKEEINDKVPGKGQALFQVNTWLNWLAEPDSEDEEE